MFTIWFVRLFYLFLIRYSAAMQKVAKTKGSKYSRKVNKSYKSYIDNEVLTDLAGTNIWLNVTTESLVMETVDSKEVRLLQWTLCFIINYGHQCYNTLTLRLSISLRNRLFVIIPSPPSSSAPKASSNCAISFVISWNLPGGYVSSFNVHVQLVRSFTMQWHKP